MCVKARPPPPDNAIIHICAGIWFQPKECAYVEICNTNRNISKLHAMQCYAGWPITLFWPCIATFLCVAAAQSPTSCEFFFFILKNENENLQSFSASFSVQVYYFSPIASSSRSYIKWRLWSRTAYNLDQKLLAICGRLRWLQWICNFNAIDLCSSSFALVGQKIIRPPLDHAVLGSHCLALTQHSYILREQANGAKKKKITTIIFTDWIPQTANPNIISYYIYSVAFRLSNYFLFDQQKCITQSRKRQF